MIASRTGRIRDGRHGISRLGSIISRGVAAMRRPGATQIRNTLARAAAVFRWESQAAFLAGQDTPQTNPNHSQLAMQTVSRWALVSLRPKPAFRLRTRTSGWDHRQDWAASRSNSHLNPGGVGRGETATTMQRACSLAPSTGVRGCRRVRDDQGMRSLSIRQMPDRERMRELRRA
jgi:hypothetical protein